MKQNEDQTQYLAKSNGETICEHTSQVLSDFAYLYKLYKNKFNENEKEIIEFLAKYHDVGKINSRFQNKIRLAMGEGTVNYDKLDKLYEKYNVEEIPHGLISALAMNYDEMVKLFGERTTKIMLSVIACHHKRKALDKNSEYLNKLIINEICQAEINDAKIEKLAKDIKFDQYNIYELLASPSKQLNNIDNEDDYINFAKFKGALNKVDYSASGKMQCEIESDDASKKVSDFFKSKGFKKNDCQQFLEANQDKNVIVIASTGIGKTEASLLWGKDSKMFYTLPLKVAINSIYERIKHNYYDPEKVVFLHSDTLISMIESESGGEVETSFEKFSLIKSLAYPLTICTVDQLFTFVKKSMGTEILPFTLSYSKLVIDEIQAYSKDILAYLIYGISVINKMGGQFLIMTATLPPFIPALLKEEGVDFVMPNTPFYKLDSKNNQIKRHYISYIKDEIDKEKIVELAKNKKVLIVVNTVFKAQQLYSEIFSLTQNVELLHSRFMQKDRKAKEEQILSFSKSDKCGIWISTQIVEASLDIDFDVLVTEMCSADSLLQRLGRCFRNRIYSENRPNCFIYDTENGKKSIYDKEIYERSVAMLLSYDNKIFTESDKVDYVNLVYNEKDLEKTYVKDIKDKIETLKNYTLDYIEKSQAEKEFRNIRSLSLLTSSSYNYLKDAGVINALLYGNRLEKIEARAILQSHSINVAEDTVRYSKKTNIKINPTEIKGYFITDNQYSFQVGLKSDVDTELSFI